MLEWLVDPNIWASLLTLTFLEIVLGIDNIIFLSIITERVAEHRRLLAQRLGLGLALFGRIALLAGLVWLTKLTAPLFEVFALAISWRDIILMGGGLFLLAKATSEIHHTVEGGEAASLRVTLRVPHVRGELARLTRVIAEQGGNICSVAVFRGEDPEQVYITFRLEGVEEDVLIPALETEGEEVVHVCCAA